MNFTIFRTGKSRVYHYRFQVHGQRVQRSTRETTKARAVLVAERAYTEAVSRANGGRPVLTLGQLIERWFAIRGPVASAAHVRSVDVFARLHLYGLGGKDVDAITKTDVEVARNQHLLERRPASANHWLRILKLVTNWGVKSELAAPVRWRVDMLKVQKRPRAILPLGVVKVWFDAIDAATVRNPAVGTAIRMMFGLGLRESESTSARWEWIDWQRATYTPGKTKGREAEPIPMPNWLLDYLAPKRVDQGLIAARTNGFELRPGFARAPMQHANAACATKGITPHRLRGTFATMLSEAGVPIQTIQRVLRHKNHVTTMGYLEKNLETAAKAQNRIGESIGLGWRENGAQHPPNPPVEPL